MIATDGNVHPATHDGEGAVAAEPFGIVGCAGDGQLAPFDAHISLVAIDAIAQAVYGHGASGHDEIVDIHAVFYSGENLDVAARNSGAFAALDAVLGESGENQVAVAEEVQLAGGLQGAVLAVADAIAENIVVGGMDETTFAALDPDGWGCGAGQFEIVESEDEFGIRGDRKRTIAGGALEEVGDIVGGDGRADRNMAVGRGYANSR